MPPRAKAAAAAADSADAELVSVILPTYNERENLPIIVWLLVREMRKSCAPPPRPYARLLTAPQRRAL